MESNPTKTYIVAAIIAVFLLGVIAVALLRPSPPETTPTETTATTTPRALSQEGAALLTYLQTTNWQLTEGTDEKGSFTVQDPIPQITFANNQLSTTICKTIFAPYRIEEDPFELRFISMSRTQTLCAGNIARPEDALVASFRDGLRVERQGNSIVLTGRKTGYQFILRPLPPR